MKSEEIRKKFLIFFANRNHKIIPSASLVPENDPSVLFNTAGMQPLVPYLLGEPHPQGNRLVNVQKCVRTVDIDDIGDSTHATFFEMLGNWSLGDYFKEEAIEYSYLFLTSKEEGLGLDPNRLYVTVFEGNNQAPRDQEAFDIWKKYIPENRIFFLGEKDNWWSPGDNGPCGPDTEMFYDLTKEGLGDLTKEEFLLATDRQQIVEIWNDVFMEFEKKDGQVIGKLKQKNVDTGSGLERITAVVQGKNNIFDTDLFEPIVSKIKSLTLNQDDIKTIRIIADHLRTAVFMIGDGVVPGNSDQGYILRRILRRAVRQTEVLKIETGGIALIVEEVLTKYKVIYKELDEKSDLILTEILKEEDKFKQTLLKGINQINKTIKDQDNFKINSAFLFDLYQSYGFPLELSLEELVKNKIKVSDDLIDGFNQLFKEHQTKSRLGAEKKFKGGLADHSEEVVKYHTTTHLLHQVLKDVLGEEVEQRGSNITKERLRFDFSYHQKMSEEQIKQVERLVNQKISESLPVNFVILPKIEAEKTGARKIFGDKYGDEVKIYYIGNDLDNAYSKEFCGGPHVENTNVLGKFKIIKEESVAAGIRRIKAVLD